MVFFKGTRIFSPLPLFSVPIGAGRVAEGALGFPPLSGWLAQRRRAPQGLARWILSPMDFCG
tara:strand:+ start:293470 stop:293655 length:186 start_codon:yes stop_codon:yes gene_type:complete